jgi:hypothetical protein
MQHGRIALAGGTRRRQGRMRMIRQDMRCAGSDTFVGTPVDG